MGFRMPTQAGQLPETAGNEQIETCGGDAAHATRGGAIMGTLPPGATDVESGVSPLRAEARQRIRMQRHGGGPCRSHGIVEGLGGRRSGALEQLTPLVYDELRAHARRCMRSERSGATLQSTAPVHEVYLRLLDADRVDWNDRVHFFALSARLMRRILVDAARARTAAKRGGPARLMDHLSPIEFDQLPADALSLCALDDALEQLTQIDPRRARVIELRFFGGLTVEETAGILQVSPQCDA